MPDPCLTSQKMTQFGDGAPKNRLPLTSSRKRLLPEHFQPFYIEADSSDFATGTVLSQQSLEDGKWHPVAFLSKSLLSIEQNYEIHDKEILVIIQAMEEWRHFLEGAEHQFEIWTYHKNQEYFMKAKNLNCRQACWSLVLAHFNFIMHYQPGKSMGKSNALSCQVDHSSGANDNEDIILLMLDLFVIQALEGLELMGEERVILREILREMEDGEREEAVAKAVKEL